MRINYSLWFSWKSAVTLLVLFLTSTSIGQAQQPDPQVVKVQSWKTGAGRIAEQVLNISLNPAQPEFEATIPDASGRWRFKLNVVHNSATETNLEFWGIVLREVLPQAVGAKEKLGENLLAEGRPGPGKHFFTRGDSVGFIYPKENPVWYQDRGDFYPIMTKRIIKIEGFYMTIRVNGYQVNEKNPKKVDFLNLTIELKNADNKATPVVAADSLKP